LPLFLELLFLVLDLRRWFEPDVAREELNQLRTVCWTEPTMKTLREGREAQIIPAVTSIRVPQRELIEFPV
jgi:hypothetical protein